MLLHLGSSPVRSYHSTPGHPNIIPKPSILKSLLNAFYVSLYSTNSAKLRQCYCIYTTPPASPIWPYIVLTVSPPPFQFVFRSLPTQPCMDWCCVTRMQIHKPNHVIGLNFRLCLQCVYLYTVYIYIVFIYTVCSNDLHRSAYFPKQWKQHLPAGKDSMCDPSLLHDATSHLPIDSVPTSSVGWGGPGADVSNIALHGRVLLQKRDKKIQPRGKNALV